MMGKKDDYQFDYLDDNRRFADQINGALDRLAKQLSFSVKSVKIKYDI